MSESVEATLSRIVQITSDTLQRVRELDEKLDNHIQKDHVGLAREASIRDVEIEKLKSQINTRTLIGGGGLGLVAAIMGLFQGRNAAP